MFIHIQKLKCKLIRVCLGMFVITTSMEKQHAAYFNYKCFQYLLLKNMVMCMKAYCNCNIYIYREREREIKN